MGSQAIQAHLWGRSPKAWSSIQEATGRSGYDHALRLLGLKPADRLLDIGCGSGLLASLAYQYTKYITGIDATAELTEAATQRAPQIPFLVGEMEDLPFQDDSYEVVTGFNSFQYAADISKAFAEAKRVLIPKGRLIAMIWGNKSDCEAAAYLAAVGSLMPPPPPGAPGPFALSEDQRLEKAIEAAGFTILTVDDIPNTWDYPNTTIALEGLLSAGPVTRAIEHSGIQKVEAAVNIVIQHYTQPDGHVVFHNKLRVLLAEKP